MGQINVNLDPEFKIEPTVMKLNDISATCAVGRKRGDSDVLVLMYSVIYKGALLNIKTEIPDSMGMEEVREKVERFVRNIDFY